MDHPGVNLAVTVGCVAAVFLVLLMLTGNIHGWNVPFIGTGCNVH